MLVSILIASRKRIHRLIAVIRSIYKTAKTEDFEILIRFDDDDTDSLGNLHILNEFTKVKYTIGPRYQGYASHSVFMDELSEIAQGEWLFFLDDDGYLIGDDWDLQLAKISLSGKIVHPEFYWLGGSKYGSGSCVPVAICVPNKCWLNMGWKKLQQPIDSCLQELLESQGWENQWLLGVTARHRRDSEKTLLEHRKLND